LGRTDVVTLGERRSAVSDRAYSGGFDPTAAGF
jgi:hypothetical protein